MRFQSKYLESTITRALEIEINFIQDISRLFIRVASNVVYSIYLEPSTISRNSLCSQQLDRRAP
uniref:Uncharacterized protein n=1 Tax=Pongo abelii TaxID=9601 RepID=H2PBN9_PONAB